MVEGRRSLTLLFDNPAMNLSRPGGSVSSDLLPAKLNSKGGGDNQRWRDIQSEGMRVSDRWTVRAECCWVGNPVDILSKIT